MTESRVTPRYTSVHGFTRDIAVIPTEIVERASEGVPFAEILQYVDGAWWTYDVDFDVIGVAVVSEDGVNRTVSVGPDGEFLEVSKRDGHKKGMIDDSRERPENRGVLRCVAEVDGQVYAAGMGRQVYRRTSVCTWERFDEGALLPLGTDNFVGFNALCGSSAAEMYAVGLTGTLFWRDEERWHEVKVPTTQNLYGVAIAGDRCIAVGAHGVILAGRHATWQMLDHGVTQQKLRAVAAVGDDVFIASDDTLFRLGTTLEPVNDMPKGASFGSLHARDAVVWSAGENDIFRFKDGAWSEIAYDRYGDND